MEVNYKSWYYIYEQLVAYCANNPVMGYDPYGTFDFWECAKGVGRIITGGLAIAVGAVVLIGGAPVAMLIIAGVTVTAGVLTLNNGIADTVGSFSGHNYMSDGLFQGNTTAYNWYSGVTEVVAMVGTVICGSFIKNEYFMGGSEPGTEGSTILLPGQQLDRYGSKIWKIFNKSRNSRFTIKLTYNKYIIIKSLYGSKTV